MVHVEMRDKSDRRGDLLFVNGAENQELLRASSIDDVFLQNQRQQTLTGRQFPISVRVGQYSSNLFTYMGVPAAVGRGFTPSDAPGGKVSPVALLRYVFLQEQVGGKRNRGGATLQLEHPLFSVIRGAPPRLTRGD